MNNAESQAWNPGSLYSLILMSWLLSKDLFYKTNLNFLIYKMGRKVTVYCCREKSWYSYEKLLAHLHIAKTNDYPVGKQWWRYLQTYNAQNKTQLISLDHLSRCIVNFQIQRCDPQENNWITWRRKQRPGRKWAEGNTDSPSSPLFYHLSFNSSFLISHSGPLEATHSSEMKVLNFNCLELRASRKITLFTRNIFTGKE